MAALFTDNFNRANGAIGANWSQLGAAPTIASNQCALPSTDALSYWNGGTPAADCYVKATFVNIGTNAGTNYTAILLRLNTTSFNWYQVIFSTDADARIRRFDGGVGTTLGAAFALPSAGQVVEFRAVGSTLSVYYDGVLQTSRTDSTYTGTGRAGFSGRGTTLRLDDFEAGEPVSGSPAAGSATGIGAAAAVGKSLKSAAGTSAGTSTATAVGKAIKSAAGAAAGVGTAVAVGKAAKAAVGAAAGVGAASAVGKAAARGVGSAAGTSTAVAAGRSVARAVGSAAGTSDATAAGQSIAKAAGSASGAATVVGIAESPIASAVGSAAGVGTATAAGKALVSGAGSASGTSSAIAVGRAEVNAAGSASATSTAVAIGAARAKAVGVAAGTGSASATGDVGLPPSGAIGTAAGTSTAAAVGRSIARAVGVAAGSSSADGISEEAEQDGGIGFLIEDDKIRRFLERESDDREARPIRPAKPSRVARTKARVLKEVAEINVEDDGAVERLRELWSRWYQAELRVDPVAPDVAYNRFSTDMAALLADRQMDTEIEDMLILMAVAALV